jgi:hypothetical protein
MPGSYLCSINILKQSDYKEGGDMADATDEDTLIVMLIERFEKQRLPRLKQLKKKVDTGKTLSSMDVEFLDTVIHDAQQSKRLIDKNPKWQKFCANVVHLYETITEKALLNEKSL